MRFNGARIGGLRCSISLPGDDATTLPCGTLRAVRRARSALARTLVEFSRFTLAQSLPVFSRTSISAALVRSGLLISKMLQAERIFLASRPSLVHFYRTSMGFQPISSLERFPAGPGDEPIILMSLSPSDERERRFPFFRIAAGELLAVREALTPALACTNQIKPRS